MTTQVSGNQPVRVKTATSVLAQTIAALVFGVVVVLVAGFAPMGVAHNAAHDARHGMTFPCH